MYWKSGGKTEYLIRTSPANSQKSLGPRNPETEAIYKRFMVRKSAAEQRQSTLQSTLVRHQRMNRALNVGRAPSLVVAILNVLAKAELADCFTVVGTHALYAYEAAAGLRILDSGALHTRDVDLLWDTRKHLQFLTRLKLQQSSMVGLLRKADASFVIRPEQPYTATNSKGFEVHILRHEVEEDDPHPIRLSEDEEDFWVTQAKNARVLLNAPRFSSMIVAASGHMARMSTVAPMSFCHFKRWLALQADRDPLKRSRDQRQADLVENLIHTYLPQWAPPLPDSSR